MDDGKRSLRWGDDSFSSGDERLTMLWPQQEMDTYLSPTTMVTVGLLNIKGPKTIFSHSVFLL